MMQFRTYLVSLSSLLVPALLAVSLLLSALPASSAAAPVPEPSSAPGSTIYVVGLKQVGMPGKDDAAGLMSSFLADALAGSFECTKTMTPSDVSTLLGFARFQQLMGTPEDQQVQLQNIASAMGNVGVLVSGSFGIVGGKYFVNIVAMNANTSKITANLNLTAGGDDDSVLFDLVEQAVSQLDLKVCRPRWTGTITVTDTMDDFFLKEVGTTTRMVTGRRRDSTSIELKGGLVSSPDKLTATISRSLEARNVNYELNEGTTDCAPGGWHNIAGHTPEWVTDRTDKYFRWSSWGQWSMDVPVRVTLNANGHYRISWDPPQLTRDEEVHDSYSRSPDVCKGAPMVTKEDTVSRKSSLDWKVTSVEGDIDRSRQDALTGFKETTTPLTSAYPEDRKTGSETMTVDWNLTRTGS